MHHRRELEADSARHDKSRVKQSVWEMRLRIHFQQCRYGLSLNRNK